MSFVYRTPDNGPIELSGNVRVIDTAPVTVISVGLRGEYGRATEDRGRRQLETWLDGQTEWARAGSPRVFYYNGPYIPDYRKWAEVQADGQTSPTAEEAGAILRGAFRSGGPEHRNTSDSESATG